MEIQTFDPVKFSNAENEFLLETLGLPTAVALRQLKYPVNPKAVKPILDRVNELEDLRKYDGSDWVGVEKLKQSIRKWQEQNIKWANDFKRSGKRAPRWPSLYSFDAKGRPHWSGPGSDSGQVRTYFGPAGERIPFEVLLVPDNFINWVAPTIAEENTDPLLYVDPDAHRIECKVPVDGGICGHTEAYKPGSRSSYNAARARISKHLRKATANADAHRELHTNEFGG
jgi:hypothetical protein